MSEQAEQQNRRVIGGVFGLPAPVIGGSAQGGQDHLFRRAGVLRLVNARSAFWLIGKTLRPRKAWLPSYLCEAVVRGFQLAEVPLEFFAVSDRLLCENNSWLNRVQDGDLVLRINYFGFLNPDPVFGEASSRGAWLVDDAAQALLTNGVGAGARFSVYSPRKFVGVPDGGCLVSLPIHSTLWPALQPPPAAWWTEAFAAARLRREFDAGGGDREWFVRFQNAEQGAPTGPIAMSELSANLLDHGFDYSAIAQARRANYLQLLSQLQAFALFPDLPEGVVPLGFPVRVQNRDAVRQALFREQVFPPVHWALDGVVPDSFSASHRLACETMTLPCDQRYNADDMSRISEIFLHDEFTTPLSTRV